MKRSRKPKPVTAGERVGTKRRDMRWAVDGEVWASRFEYQVYRWMKDNGYNVIRCGSEASLCYTSNVRGGVCKACGSDDVAQQHTYTPDLRVVPQGGGDDAAYYIEAKGYLRAERRALLRAARKAHPTCDLRLVAQSDYKVGAGRLSDWARKYLKVPVHIWNGSLPGEWK